MSLEQKVIIRCHGFHLGESVLDAEKRTVNIFNRDAENLLNERSAASAVNYREQDPLPVSSRKDEVSFNIPDTTPGVDIRWSLVNEGTIRERFLSSSPPPSAPFLLEPVCLDMSAIDRCDVAVDGVLGYGREMFFSMRDSARNG